MKILRDNSLTMVLVLATLATIIGMVIAGHSVYSDELSEHGGAPIAFSAYLTSGHFLSSLFRELGERIPPDERLCRPDGFSVSARIGGV